MVLASVERRATLPHVLLASSGLVKQASAGPLKAGVARRVVTPPVRVPYLTSSVKGTNAPFGGVHDDLHARERARTLDHRRDPAGGVLGGDDDGDRHERSSDTGLRADDADGRPHRRERLSAG